MCQKKIIVTLLNITLQCFDDRSDPLLGLQVHYRALCAALLLTVAAPLMDPCPDCAEMSCTTIEISRYEAAVNTNIRPRPRTRASRGPGRRVIKPDIEQYRHPQSPGCPTIGKCWSRPAQESRDYGNDGKCIDK